MIVGEHRCVVDEVRYGGTRDQLPVGCIDQGRFYLQFLKNAGADVTLECNGQTADIAVSNQLQPLKLILTWCLMKLVAQNQALFQPPPAMRRYAVLDSYLRS